MKIWNGTKIQLFRKVRCWDPLKTILGSGFEKTWKNHEKTIGKSMVFDCPKPLRSIENKYFPWFLVIPKNNAKTMPKGTSKGMFFVPKWRHGPPRFDLSSDLCRFGVMPTNDDFGTPSRWSKKSEYLFVSGRVCCEIDTTLGQRGPQGGTLFAHETLREKIQANTPEARGPANSFTRVLKGRPGEFDVRGPKLPKISPQMFRTKIVHTSGIFFDFWGVVFVRLFGVEKYL